MGEHPDVADVLAIDELEMRDPGPRRRNAIMTPGEKSRR